MGSDDKCELCDRIKELTSHHLIPKQVHSKNWCKKMWTRIDMKGNRAMLCKLCHKTIHNFFTHRELGGIYYTVELLKSNVKIIEFLKWAKKQK